MATSIPDVHLHLLLGTGGIRWILNAYYLLEVGASNCHIMHLIESILTETQCDGRLTDGRIS